MGAEQLILPALRVARERDDAGWLCDLLQNYAQAFRPAPRFAEADAACAEALALADEMPTTQQLYIRANIEYEIGKLARDQGEWATAHTYFRRIQAVFRPDSTEQGFNPERAWGLLGNVGFIEQQLGHGIQPPSCTSRRWRSSAKRGRRLYDHDPDAAGGLRRRARELQRRADIRRRSPRVEPPAGLVKELEQIEALCARLPAHKHSIRGVEPGRCSAPLGRAARGPGGTRPRPSPSLFPPARCSELLGPVGYHQQQHSCLVRRSYLPWPVRHEMRSINVTEAPFCADPTGILDSTNAFQSALNAAHRRSPAS